MTTLEEKQTFHLLLRILALAQFVMAVLAGTALVLIVMLYGDTVRRAANPNRAAELSALASHQPVFLGVGVLAAVALVGGVVSGIGIWRHRRRAFSQGMAVVSLLLFPVGTVIGLATLITLAQKPVRDLFDS
jgi:hypothetical protein